MPKYYLKVTMMDPSGDADFYVNVEHILGLQPLEKTTIVHMPDRGTFQVREHISYFDKFLIK